VRLEPGQAARLQLPNGHWLKLTDIGRADDGRVRLDLAIKAMEFRTTALLAPGATLAVGGPPYEKGALILAIRWPTENL
jgi:hypothetical protein